MSKKNSKTAMVMAGGTGGHVFPALAVAKELKALGVDVYWLGTRAGIEATKVPEAGFPIFYLSIGGLRGKGKLTLLLAPFKLAMAISQALYYMLKVKPSVVLGMGGFASGPGGVASKLLGKSLVVHEQNAVAGMTNKLLAKVANKVLTGFDGIQLSVKEKFVGNPVRTELMSVALPEQRYSERTGGLHVLVVGGSLGATALNELLPEALAVFEARVIGTEVAMPIVRHQCGERHLNKTLAAYKKQSVDAEVTPFIADMAEAYGWADLVICRSGALTVAEVSAVGVAALFIPFPFAVDDHQTANAQALVEAGAAKMAQQNELNSELLASMIESLNDRSLLQGMAVKAKAYAHVNATEQVTNDCLEYIHG